MVHLHNQPDCGGGPSRDPGRLAKVAGRIGYAARWRGRGADRSSLICRPLDDAGADRVLTGTLAADCRCCGVFLDRWAAEAIRCGWSDLDVFGVDPDRPDARFDAMGLVLLLDRREIVSIDERGVDLITSPDHVHQRYYRRPRPVGTVLLWDSVVAKRGRDAG